jgi:hypothetical protein
MLSLVTLALISVVSAIPVHLPLVTENIIHQEFMEWSKAHGRSFAFVSGMRDRLLLVDSVHLVASTMDSAVPLFFNPSWSYVTFSNHTYVDLPAWIPIVQVTIPIQKIKLVLTYTSFVDLSIVAEHLLPLWLIYTTVFLFFVRKSNINLMFKVALSSLSLLFCICLAWAIALSIGSRLVK